MLKYGRRSWSSALIVRMITGSTRGNMPTNRPQLSALELARVLELQVQLQVPDGKRQLRLLGAIKAITQQLTERSS